MHRVALATYTSSPDELDIPLFDYLLIVPLAEHNVQAESVAWDDPSVDWSVYDLVALRSTWNYHNRLSEFLTWIEHLESLNVRLCNPPDVVRWNTNKLYLKDLAELGAKIVPTVFASASDSLTDIMDEQGWSDVVIKPRYGASAFGVEIFNRDAVPDDIDLMDMLVQPKMTEIQTAGEVSLVFIAGDYSHAVLKRPAEGKIFVQIEHGGTETLVDVSLDMIEQAGAILTAALKHLDMESNPLVYARVDGVIIDAHFHLMELELIEPALFLNLYAPAIARLADAIVKQL